MYSTGRLPPSTYQTTEMRPPTTPTGTKQRRVKFKFWGSEKKPLVPSVPSVVSDELDSLRSLIRTSFFTVKDGADRRFLPAGCIRNFTNPQRVGAALFPENPGSNRDLVRFVTEKARRIFLCLVQQQHLCAADLVLLMKDCRKNRIDDSSLPIKCHRHSSDPEHNPNTACAHHQMFHGHLWGRVLWDLQEHLQGPLLSPVFTRKFETYRLSSKCALPLTNLKSTGKGGHFSVVHKALLHRDHLETDGASDWTFTTEGTRSGFQLAIKDMSSSNESQDKVEDIWKHEVHCLGKLSDLRHPHLVRPLAAIEQAPKYYIMFEWADGGSLRDVWNNQGHSPLSLTQDRIMSLLEQFCGLAGALSAMHNTSGAAMTTFGNLSSVSTPSRTSRESRTPTFKATPTASSQNLQVPELRFDNSSEDGSYISQDEVHWRHGDLKPDNILVFKATSNSSGWLGTLKIADLGLAKQHVLSTSRRMERTGQRYTTSRYEAPEAMDYYNKPRSRKYDIWSMGCIMLEFVILLLYGKRGLDLFYSEHKNDNHATDTLYFTVTDARGGTAEVSNIIDYWIGKILQDRECSREEGSALRDLVLLVRDKLLVVDLQYADMTVPGGTGGGGLSRIGAGELQEELKRILRRARKKPSYIVLRERRADVAVPGTCPGGRRIKTRGQKSRSMLGDDLPRTHVSETARNQETHARLDTTWEYAVENDFAIQFLAASKDNRVAPISPGRCEVRKCPDCPRLSRVARSKSGSSRAFTLEGGLANGRENGGRNGAGCPSRSLVFRACSSFLQDTNRKPQTIEIHRNGSNLFLRGYSAPVLSLRRWTDDFNRLNLNSLKCVDIQIGPPGLVRDPRDPAYFELLSSWLRDCDQDHQQCRLAAAPRHSDRPFLPTRLLDVGWSHSKIRLCETKSLKFGQPNQDMRYVALSHPWGDGKTHNHFCTTHANLGQRVRAGVRVQDFPDTLKDAIYVARGLKIPYLWIDSLCIIQGSDGDFESEAKRMEMVYSMAYLVIAASRATGTSDGFLSPRPRRQYTALPPRSQRGTDTSVGGAPREEDGTIYLCEAIDDFQKDVINGALNKRGWVLQERVLARRTIYFTQNQTYFECGAGVHCETLTRMTNNQASFLGDPNFPTIAMKSTKGAKIRLCQLLYETYSALQFTKPQDRSIAIAGLEQRLVRAYDTDGAYGVLDGGPSFFGRTLLWMRNARVQDAMHPINFDVASYMYYRVPSWSWMACEGVISYMDLPFSTVEWRYVEEGVVAPWTVFSDINDSEHLSSDPVGATTTILTRSSTRGSAVWHTGRTEWKSGRDGPALKARARKLNLPGLEAKEEREKIIYDAGHRPEAAEMKCVIIGRKKRVGTDHQVLDADTISTIDHYVLVVAHKRDSDLHADEYVRVGVGSIPGSWIDQVGQGENITIV
ncbi:hypothetical protein QBC37DRAFT_397678 [Rhypophila decipiens]|uniref:Protein kinase domain-containing protein n=1 Tax=Rhypophila decipiens TaxID=261697 RepID=A0AAN6YBY3_9PEZI|nr:hypothetical protein QBC37DRAFT_397678 [Rhypophila decipiens]